MNINKEWFSHAIENRRFGVDDKRQQGVNSKRLARVEKAMYRLPVYIPMRWDLPAVAPIAPISASTPDNINYDVLIVGAISDSPNREIRFKASNTEINPSYLGLDNALKLRLGDIAGTTTDFANEAQVGVFNYTSPFILHSGSQLTIEMFKENSTNAEVSNLVFVGYRIFKEKQSYLTFAEDEKEAIISMIARREVPRQIFLKSEVNFLDNKTETKTPTVDEPLIIRGVKTNLLGSTIEAIKFISGMEWGTGEFPSWAIFTQPNGNHNYLYFKEPLYLPKKSQIQIKLRNTIEGSTYIDSDGEITWLCETV